MESVTSDPRVARGEATIITEQSSSGPYRVHITPADVGRRVAVRRVLDDGRSGLGDVLGELVSWTGEGLQIRTRTGDVVHVEEARMLSGRVIPPAPARRPRA